MSLVFLVELASQAFRAGSDFQDRLDLLDSLGHKASLEPQASLEPTEVWGQRDHEDPADSPEAKVSLVDLDFRVSPDPKDPLDLLVLLAFLEPLVQLVCLDSTADLAVLGRLVLQVIGLNVVCVHVSTEVILSAD